LQKVNGIGRDAGAPSKSPSKAGHERHFYLHPIFKANLRFIKNGDINYYSQTEPLGYRNFSMDAWELLFLKELYMPLLKCVALSVLFLALSASSGLAQSGIITTYVGPGLPVNGELAVSQSVDYPTSVVPDGANGFYVVSQAQNRVYRVDANGKIRLVAGNGIPGYSGDGRPAASAQLNRPWGAVVDGAGNLYIADTLNHRIRKVTPDGAISTFAGNGTQGFSGDDGPATAAQLISPMGVAIDSAGNFYIADYYDIRVRKVMRNGVISTVAGNGNPNFGNDGGLATTAQLISPMSVAVDAAGNLYIADSKYNRVRMVTAAGVIETVAGNYTSGFSGDGGPATEAKLNNPNGVAVDSTGNLYIADYGNNRVRMVTAAGVIRTVAGNGTEGYSGDGGLATEAKLNNPNGVAVDSAGNLYIADSGNNRVRIITAAGVIRTIAGNGTSGFIGGDGSVMLATLNFPTGVAVDSAGNLYIADTWNNRVRKVSVAGVISTVAGNGAGGFSGDGGPATSASLYSPAGVAVDSTGNLYIADSLNYRVRMVTAAGVIHTVAGDGTHGFSGDN
jgi:trimeric autotransporter adhesin